MYAHAEKRRRWSATLGSILFALAAAGCPGNVDPSLLPVGGGGNSGNGGSGGTPTCDPAPLFAAHNCSLAGCHDATGTSANFEMVSATWQAQLVGVNPKGGGGLASMCAGMGPYLVPGSVPATGLFLDKLKDGTTPACGVLMPLVGEKLTTADFDCVQRWANALVTATAAAEGDL